MRVSHKIKFLFTLANSSRFDNNFVLMRNGARLSATIVVFAIFFAISPVIAASPPDLIEMERQVWLKLAHVRDSGPTDPAQRKQLFEAKIRRLQIRRGQPAPGARDSAPAFRLNRRRRIHRACRFW